MTALELIKISKARFDAESKQATGILSLSIFTLGAKWMFEKLDPDQKEFDHSVNFGFYGFLKYSASLLLWIVSVYFLYMISPFLIPLSVFVFYFVEVHFLFLFPLLIDRSERPVLTSIKLTYKIGLFKAMFAVMQIGIYMLAGLFNFKDPFRNWYVGCLSIITWYQNEIRNRI